MLITTPILTHKVMNSATERGLKTLFDASPDVLTFGAFVTFENTGFGGVRQTAPELVLLENGDPWPWAELSPEHHTFKDEISKALLCLHCDPFLNAALVKLHRAHMCFSIQEKYFIEYLPGMLWIRRFKDETLKADLDSISKQILLGNADPTSPALWRYGAVVHNVNSSHQILNSLSLLQKSLQWTSWRETLEKTCHQVQNISFSPPTQISP